VLPVRYELNLYMLIRRNYVCKGLMVQTACSIGLALRHRSASVAFLFVLKEPDEKLAEAAMLLTCIREVLPSNLGRGTDYHYRFSLCFFGHYRHLQV
jgi:hypothetical protein